MNKVEIYLKNSIKKNKLPRVMLLLGPDEDIKFLTAIKIMTGIFCNNNQETGNMNLYGCQKCFICAQILAQNHPCIQIIKSDPELKSEIQIKKIKEITLNSKQVSWIFPAAHHLNKSASNLLSRIIETPTKDRFFILITSYAYMLPSTLVSKCSHIFFRTENINPVKNNTNYEIPEKLIDRMSFIEELIKSKIDLSILLKYWSRKASKDFKQSLLNAEHDNKAHVNKQLILESLLLSNVQFKP